MPRCQRIWYHAGANQSSMKSCAKADVARTAIQDKKDDKVGHRMEHVNEHHQCQLSRCSFSSVQLSWALPVPYGCRGLRAARLTIDSRAPANLELIAFERNRFSNEERRFASGCISLMLIRL